jgi:hypothetical protein
MNGFSNDATMRMISRRVLRLGLACVITLLAFSVASNSEAASLERLPDGRVVLTVLGERLAFREVDADRVGLYLPSDVCRSKNPTGVMLRQWLDDPAVAECLRTAIPDTYVPRNSVTFRVYLGYEDGTSYPGKGKRLSSLIGDLPPLYPGGVTVDELPQPSLLSSSMFVTVRDPIYGMECMAPIEGRPDDLGYQGRQAGKSPPTMRFTRSSEKRPDRPSHATRPACIGCTQISGWNCAIGVKSKDNRVAVSVQWHDWDFHGPRPEWALYDTIARKIAESIFSSRDGGDIQ